MKTILSSIILLFFVSLTSFGQNDEVTVCHTSSTEKFAAFASDPSFNAEHPTPRVYKHVTQAGGRMIKFKTPDGAEANAYLIEAKNKTDNWIFVFQEWWGLNDNIKRESENLHSTLGNVNVIALDMYDGKVATTAQEAGQTMQQFKEERGMAIMKGALAYVGPKARIGTIGWCFGGGLSLLASIAAEKQGVACVMYYGMPTEDVEKLKKLNTDVLNIWPTKDQRINKEVMDKFAANMEKAGKKLTIKSYDADHAFANPSNAKGYNEAAAKDAWSHTVEYFKARFK
ncbi:MAG TPA: dienelactone hydrolase family protein [Cyclobacteriaceae bacterium]|nr:dienelactone hydrolase family protein [Cyclobacteriaceae bacterium]